MLAETGKALESIKEIRRLIVVDILPVCSGRADELVNKVLFGDLDELERQIRDIELTRSARGYFGQVADR